jgi:hypothetical protein
MLSILTYAWYIVNPICGFHMYKFAYSPKFICNLELNACGNFKVILS